MPKIDKQLQSEIVDILRKTTVKQNRFGGVNTPQEMCALQVLFYAMEPELLETFPEVPERDKALRFARIPKDVRYQVLKANHEGKSFSDIADMVLSFEVD